MSTPSITTLPSKLTPLKKVAIIAAAATGLIIAGAIAFAAATPNEEETSETES